MKFRPIIAAVAWLATASALAAPADTIKQNVEAMTGGQVTVQRVQQTPAQGIYEVLSDGEIFYTDATGRFGIVGGALVDMQTQTDLTSKAMDKLTAIPFDALPLEHAISKDVHGDGSRQMALFEDPNCPVCRVFTKFVDQLDDVTIYRIPYPVISPESQTLAKVAWCSSDRARAWRALMNGQRFDGPQDCDITGLVAILKFGDKHRINATPTVFLGNGKRLVGATPPDQFIEELDASARPN